MILTDRQRWIVSAASETIPAEKQATFRSRLEGVLRHRTPGRVTDDDVSDACATARFGLVQAVAEAEPVAVAAPRLDNIDHRSRLIPKR